MIAYYHSDVLFIDFLCTQTHTGSVDKGVVEVTNCFCVPHKEHDDQVEAELSYALDVYELNRRVNPSENIVGKQKECEVIFLYICEHRLNYICHV